MTTPLRAWLDALMSDPTEGPHQDALIAAQRDTIKARAEILVWISLVVMPTTIWSYTLVNAPDQILSAIVIVTCAMGAAVAHRFAIRAGVYDRHYHLAMFLLVAGIFGPTGSAILEISRFGEGSFLFAFFLIFFAFGALFPATAGWFLATCVTVIASLIGARAFRAEGFAVDSDLVNRVLYLGELTFIGFVLNRVVVNLFFAERRSALELAAANAELRQLDQAKTAFFSNVSHELRTPLTLILAPLKHLLDKPGVPPDIQAELRGVHGNGMRLLKMMNQLLDFSRVEAGQAEVVPLRLRLDDVIEHVADLFRGAARERGLALQVEIRDPGMRVVQDLDKLEQILVNLVGNAMKFTPRGGTVTLSTRAVEAGFEVAVTDTGVGIPKAAQSRIFERFAQLENSSSHGVRGTGIGLSMVKEYAELLGGKIAVDSEPGKGSKFTLTLPISVGDAVQDWTPEHRSRVAEDGLATADLAETSAPRRDWIVDKAGPDKPWILIVDDNPALVNLVRTLLEDTHNLYLGYSAEDGLDWLEKAPRVDLVISDVMMPGISGLEFCKRIKSDPRFRLIPVVLLTARGGGAAKVEGLEHGADDYIGKPFDPDELRARVRQLFELRRVTRAIEDRTREVEAAHKELKEQELKLIASEKMRTMGDLAAGIFHELHNYLNMIHNGAQPLRDLVVAIDDKPPATEDLDEMKELADLVLESAEQARNVTAELKGYAHQDAALHRVVDIHQILKSNLRMFGKIPATLNVELEPAADRIPVNCAPTRLVQVFTNLVKNSFEAMEQRGTVRIATAVKGPVVQVRVTDTGPGIDPKFAAKLFEPFQSTKKQGDGLGLGLSLARKVVEDHGGTLEADLAHRGGACFVVTLPIANQA